MKTLLIFIFAYLPCLSFAQTGSANQTDSASKAIHIFVALCDNKYQGIVPVPAKIGNGQLVAYTGHDGLMDFQLTETYANADARKRDIIILACYSKRFFSPHLRAANVNPLVWTTGLMCPEAYTLHDAITGYVNNETNENIRKRAAKSYSTYQKCSEKAARNLLVTGW
jgi:hypothetical protein